MASFCRSLLLTPFFCCSFLLTHFLCSAVGPSQTAVPSVCTCSSKECLLPRQSSPAVLPKMSSSTFLVLYLFLCSLLRVSSHLLCLLPLAGALSAFSTPKTFLKYISAEALCSPLTEVLACSGIVLAFAEPAGADCDCHGVVHHLLP